MRLGISALLFNLDKALELCREVDKINHIEVGIDNLDECIKLSKYKGEFDKLNLSLGIHLPMELNSCENIKYIRKSWIDFINKIEDGLKDLNIEYFNMHLGYVISERLYKKCGWKDEGVQRDFVYKNGEWRNLVVMGLLESDYREIEKKMHYWDS